MTQVVDHHDLIPSLREAWRVALDQAHDDPPVPLPAGLLPFRNFRAESPPLPQLRAVLESDPDLRARICDALSEEEVGRVGWLWLSRPEGWEDDVASLRDERGDARYADARSGQAKEALKRLGRRIEKGGKKTASTKKARREAEARLRECQRDAREVADRLEQADAAHKRAEAELRLAERRGRERNDRLAHRHMPSVAWADASA